MIINLMSIICYVSADQTRSIASRQPEKGLFISAAWHISGSVELIGLYDSIILITIQSVSYFKLIFVAIIM